MDDVDEDDDEHLSVDALLCVVVCVFISFKSTVSLAFAFMIIF